MVIPQRTAAVSSYLNRPLSGGRVAIALEEAQKARGVRDGAFQDAPERQQRKHHLVSARRGFHVIVPPQHRAARGQKPRAYSISACPLLVHESCPSATCFYSAALDYFIQGGLNYFVTNGY
jgi:hypothetical protein